jgi:hypothetical protein
MQPDNHQICKQQQQAISSSHSSGRRRRASTRATADGSGSEEGQQQQPPPPQQGPPRGRALGPQHVPAIAARWRPLLPDDAQERNRLLSRRMKALSYPDPFAYDIFKQDGKEYM